MTIPPGDYGPVNKVLTPDQKCILQLIEDVKFLLSFAPNDVIVPSGLNPMFYYTLSSEGDQKLADRISMIKTVVNTIEDDLR